VSEQQSGPSHIFLSMVVHGPKKLENHWLKVTLMYRLYSL